MANKSINQLNDHEISYVGPPPKPTLFLHELIPQIPSLGITEFDSSLFKTFWKLEELWKSLAKRKNGSEFYLKSEFLRPKTLRMKFKKN